jgi:hypothetical protein
MIQQQINNSIEIGEQAVMKLFDIDQSQADIELALKVCMNTSITELYMFGWSKQQILYEVERSCEIGQIQCDELGYDHEEEWQQPKPKKPLLRLVSKQD